MKKNYPMIALLCVSMFYTSSAIAGKCTVGNLEICQKEASQGDTNAQCNLALMYQSGFGVAQDDKQAIKWFTKAAEQDTDGYYSLTLALYYLDTVDKNDNERRNQGLLWFEKAAALDKSGVNARKLADFLWNSGEIDRTRQIVRLYKKAAILGDARSQAFLGAGYLVLEREGFRDYDEDRLKMMHDELYVGVTKKNQGYSLADYWFKKSVKQAERVGDRFTILAEKYNKKQGRSDDVVDYWLKKAMKQEERVKNGITAIAEEYKVQGKSDKVFYWYKEAASRGDAAAQNQVGRMYELGVGVVKNIEQAKYWYLKSAESGNASAQNSLGFIYESKTPDDKASKYWYAKAMAQGHPFARMRLEQ
ncbi:MAG: tetratricopeptide repeat protein [Mariprofundaceae bacterium]|nr:tetratricopeptide repeat protein [Mariprofundaceae bacterium]